jgi:hypothetical protein
METKTKALLVALVFTIVGFLLEGHGPVGALLWPPSPANPQPTGTQVPLFAVLGLAEAAVFGLGAAFLAFGYRDVARHAASGRWALATWLSIGWLLVNWVPHDSLHQSVGMDLDALLGIEYGFHVTLMLAGLVVAKFFFDTLPAARAVARPLPAREAAVLRKVTR